MGFISDLPTELIESFKATLDELKSADLLLHVIDISDPDCEAKFFHVNKILKELNVSKIPQIIVNNKCDLISKSQIINLLNRYDEQIFISADQDNSFGDLRTKINNALFHGMYTGWISMENNLGNIRAALFDMGCIQEEKISVNGKMFANIKIVNGTKGLAIPSK